MPVPDTVPVHIGISDFGLIYEKIQRDCISDARGTHS
jgi:hypothetical protein